ncbi:MAG: hypothetical protein Q8N51_20600 [Gammaproteobacteria bacterium]|nr:hypothetical protein [Gammaproteobacteria bacterium]
MRHPLFMRPTPESELEQVIDRALRALPGHRAPATLLPRLRQAIAERESRPWWQRPAASWPGCVRGLFLVGATALAGALLYFAWGISFGISLGALAAEAAEATQRLESLLGVGRSLLGAVQMLVRSAGPWLPWSAAGVVVASYRTTVALGTYCYRLVAQRG